jgi:hypothetical protein
MYNNSRLKGPYTARKGRPESGTNAKILVRQTTAICFRIFNFDLTFLKEVQSSKQLNTKMFLSPIVGRRDCI